MSQAQTQAQAVPVAPRADPSLHGKLRRRGARLWARRLLAADPPCPIVSFSFDDAPASAFHAGAEVVEAAGARATFYVCAGLFGQDSPSGRHGEAEDVRRVAQAGHEIGCHSLSHLECGPADAATLLAETQANLEALAPLCAKPPTSFAFPYGDVSARAKRTLAPRFRLLRAIHPGLLRRGSDLNQAPSVGLQGPDGEALVAAWIDRAAEVGAWLIIYAHDVDDAPSPWGCTPAALERLIARAQAIGCAILPVGAALDRVEGRA